MVDLVAEAVVSTVIEKITNQLINEFKFLPAVSDQVHKLQVKLQMIQSFLRDREAIMHLEEGRQLRTIVSQFRDIAYDSEDVIDTYVLKIASMSRAGRGGFIGFLKKPASIFKKWLYIHQVGNKIETINARISQIKENLFPRTVQDTVGTSTESRRSRQGCRRSYAHDEEEHVVGLDGDIEKLVRELNNEEADARVVSIVGIGGSGKTTLAKRLYNHVLVKKHFDCRAWVFISQQWDSRDVLRSILLQTSSDPDEERKLIDKMKNEELVERLYNFLEERLYLLVLDDIWETNAWDELSHAFPRGKVGSKLILTTRNHSVPWRADPLCVVHEPRGLTDDEAWELLSKKTKLKEESTSQEVIELCKLGKEMVKRCGGLPLAVVVLGGLLATKPSLQEWKKLLQNIGVQLRTAWKEGAQQQGVLDLSYDDLPCHLKRSFLYLGLFPEDADIRAKRLIRMWIAEGFILSSEIDREQPVESAGEDWLEELIQRSLIQVGRRDTDGRVKTCRMHDLIRDLCLEKAREENFFEILSPSSPSNPKGLSSINGTDAPKVRRIALHTGNDSDFTKSFLLKNRNFGIRSLLYFGSGLELSESEWKTVCTNLPLIRVLHLQEVKFNEEKLPKQIGNLLHLKYLGLVDCRVREIPQSFGNLQNLHILDCKRCYNPIRCQNVFLKMEQLRYLCVWELMYKSKEFRVDALKNLRCFGRVEAGSWMFRDLQHLTSLETLGVFGIATAKEVDAVLKSPCITSGCLRSLSLSLESESYEFPSLEPLSYCKNLSRQYISGKIRETRQTETLVAGESSQQPQNEGQFLLPLQLQLPPNLTKLFLHGSRLEKQDPLAALEKLPYLKYLCLSEKSFLGTKMTCSANGFPQLQHLEFWYLPKLEEWIIEKGAMPCLRHLQIHDCIHLRTIPEGLRFISSLKELVILDPREKFKDMLRKVKTKGDETTTSTTTTSQEVGEDFYKIQHIPVVLFDKYYQL